MKKCIVVFPNSIDVKTGKTVAVEVPDTKKFRRGIEAAGKAGRKAGKKIRKLVKSCKKK